MMSEPGFYNGKHYTEYVEMVKALKRNNELEDAINLLNNLILATEEEAKVKKWGVAPWYYEQAAIIYRKQEDYESEIRVLKRYLQNIRAPGAKPPELVKRLEKAKALKSKNQQR